MTVLTFVNHASFLVESAGIVLLCDPWLEGSAFNNGWNLISPSAFTVEDFQKVTHIWFSHEHPDHFHPPSLKKIPEDVRSRITVIYQKTKDRKVLEHCKKMGFAVQELDHAVWAELAPTFRVMCKPFAHYDSWLLIEAGGKRILNLNDCEVNNESEAGQISKHTGPVDLLCAQFSYACWKADKVSRQAAATQVITRLAAQVNKFQAKLFMPFASFIYFSHEENTEQNDSINSVGAAANFISENTNASPVVLYPGESWAIGSEHDNETALSRYEVDYAAIPRVLNKVRIVPLSELQELAIRYREGVQSRNNRLFIRLFRLAGFMPGVRFYVTDLQQSLDYDVMSGLTLSDRSAEDADVAISSDSLSFLFKFDWGLDTLHVNGRLKADKKGMGKLMSTFSIGVLNNTGRTLGPQLLLDWQYASHALHKLIIHSR